MGHWRPWTERVLRWARIQSVEWHEALAAALKAREAPITHDCADKSTYFWAHPEDWIEDSQAASIAKMVREDDGVESFRQLNKRFVPHTALTKSHRLKAIQKFS